MRRAHNKKALVRIKDLMWALAFAGLVVGVGRFAYGLGASTNMMDALPWGWWKVFNMVAGAALATSGFVVAAIIYILQLDRYRPVARLSVVVGFLGYGASLAALIFDIGLPHRGWHPFFMWNPHSFLFEVFWCVSIYWGVTALELLPILTERFPLHKVTHWLHEKMLPFVVLGITLSTMHHSSLGSLFMASPTRLHPLWHSLWIPPEFFVSAMGAGLSTIVLLMLVGNWLYGWKRDAKVLDGLAKGSAWMLGIYLALKVADFTVHRKWGFVFGPDIGWEGHLFRVEITLQAIVPLVVLSTAQLRRRTGWLIAGTGSAFLGLIVHRIDTGIVGYFRSSDAVYIPSLSELLLSFGVLSAAGLAFFFLVERFNVLEEPEMEIDEEGHEHPKVPGWTREELRALLTGEGAVRVGRIMLLCVPLTWIALSQQATGAFTPIRQPVSQALHATDALRSTFLIDADRNGMGTPFPHEAHVKELQKAFELENKEATCPKCHHLDLPNDRNTACRRCHRDMEIDTPIFDLERHRDRFETADDLESFVSTVDLEDRRQTYQACLGCHRDNMWGLGDYERKGLSMQAPGFKQAMHGSCLTCHRQREETKKEDPADPKSRGNCLFCHRDWADEGLFDEEKVAKIEVVEPH